MRSGGEGRGGVKEREWTYYPDHILSNTSVCASCTCTHVSFNRFFKNVLICKMRKAKYTE